MRDRWATFDCYGTLIDWNAGIRGVLERLAGAERAPELLRRYHDVERAVQAEDEFRPYADVLAVSLERVARDAGLDLREGHGRQLPESLPDWPPFPEARPALEELRRRGWRTAILSNTDRPLIEASQRRLGVPFDEVVVAGEIGSYKPAHGHWHTFFERTDAVRDRHVHVGASLYHDVAPARELGLNIVWINRGGEESYGADAEPDRELPDLAPLPETLDELVPA